MASCFGPHALSVEGVVGMEKGEGVECKKKENEPDNSEIRGLIAQIENCLALKRKLHLVPDPLLRTQIKASSSAFGRTISANRPLRTSTAPATTVVTREVEPFVHTGGRTADKGKCNDKKENSVDHIMVGSG